MNPESDHIKSDRDDSGITSTDTVQQYKRPSVFYRVRRAVKFTAGAAAGLFLLLLISILALRWVNPPFTAFTLMENWEEIGIERYDLRDEWVPVRELPGHLAWAVIASEDQRFWIHRGLDIMAIDRAIEEQRQGERVRGASTITQQVAKNLYLWPGRSMIRKGIEAVLALIIEVLWPKERILEVYLNIAEFAPGLFGVGNAVPEIFSVTPGELTPEESARLAAVLPSPGRMRAEPPSPYTRERSQWILRQMEQLTGNTFLPETSPDITDTTETAGPE